MTAAMERIETGAPLAERRLPPVPWRDAHTVSPEALARYIETLELACERDPQSADLRTCLGMAYAMNFEVYKSMDALEAAVQLAPDHFWAQVKYGELLYRLRACDRAEEETLRAADLAMNAWELSVARKLLQEIRRAKREGTQRPAFTKPLARPALLLAAMSLILCLVVIWK